MSWDFRSVEKDINWAYIAGFMDGEGHIQKRAKATFEISIGQISERDDVLYEIEDFLIESDINCYICINVSRAGSLRNPRSMTYLRIAGKRSVYDFLRGVLPYARVKRDEIDRALNILMTQGNVWDRPKIYGVPKRVV